MRYVNQSPTGSYYAYPDHNVKPSEKGRDWCMKYAQAAYYDFYTYPKGVFFANGGDYEKYRMYAQGKQPINQYKSLLGVDMQTMETQMVVDWTARAIISGYRDKAISRLMKEDYSVVATPVDSQSKSELEAYYSQLRTKIIMRETLQQQNSELSNHPILQMNPGDPIDMEELAMRIQNGEQFIRSMDVEMAIELGFYENNYTSQRKMWYEDLFDFGVAAYREWLGNDNKAKFERIYPGNVICSYSKDATFSDLVHVGVVLEVPLVELATITDADGNLMFTDDELQEFAGTIAGKFGNPNQLARPGSVGYFKPYDKFKCNVFECYFYTYNELTYTDRRDSNNNPVFRMEVSGRGELTNTRYKRKKIQYVYKCKWIVGTDKCYDWGMMEDQPRAIDDKKKAYTSLPIKLTATNFYEMRAQGMMERLIPYIDDYQLTILKIQNWKNRAVPSGWWINIDMLENVAKNKGGKNMSPKEMLQMYFDSGILIGRTLNDTGEPLPGGTQPIMPMQNSIMAELAGYHNELLNIVATIEKMTGYNDITNGNPNPKTLVPGFELANQATNDALYPLAFAEESLTLRLAQDVLCRMQQGVRKGEITGYAPYKGALGENTLKFISIDKEGILRDHGIELQKRSTQQEKEWIFQWVQQDIVSGLLSTADAIAVIYTHNAKQAISILAYKIEKAKKQLQANELQKIQVNNQGQMQTTQLAADLAQKQKEAEYAHLQAMEQIQAEKEVSMLREKLASQERIAQGQNMAKIVVADTTGHAKVLSTDIAGQHQQVKQNIANQKEEAAEA